MSKEMTVEEKLEKANKRIAELEFIQKAYDKAINETKHRKSMVELCKEINKAVRDLKNET